MTPDALPGDHRIRSTAVAITEACPCSRVSRARRLYNARAITQEFSEMSRHRAVGGIGKPPLLQRALGPVRPRPRFTKGKDSVQQKALDFGSQPASLRACDHA